MYDEDEYIGDPVQCKDCNYHDVEFYDSYLMRDGYCLQCRVCWKLGEIGVSKVEAIELWDKENLIKEGTKNA